MKKYILFLLLLSSSIIAQEDVYLNFENASLANVVEYIASKKNINLIPHKDLKNQQVTLTTHTPFSLEKAWDILLTLLETSGYTIINVNDLYRIVPKDQKGKQPLPSYIGSDIDKIPDNDKSLRYLYLFKNINVEKIKPVLDTLLAPGSIQYNNNLNLCLITEKSANIKSAMKIIFELDSGGLRESIQIIRLKEADAQNVAEIFKKGIFDEESPKKKLRIFVPKNHKDSNYFSSSTKIIPEPRNNSLIMLGTKDNLEKIKAFITKYIDIPLVAPKSRLHIKELKYTKADRIKPILDEIIKPPVKDVKFNYFEDVKIAAELSVEPEEADDKKLRSITTGNRLIIACNNDDWVRLEEFIDKIDKPQPQVALEVLFVDVSLEDSKELSTQLRNKTGMLGKHVNAQTQHIRANPASFSDNLRSNLVNTAIDTSETIKGSYFTLGRDTDVHAVLKGVLRSNNSHVITQPYTVVNNRQTSKLEVAEDRVVDGAVSGDSTSAVRAKDNVKAKTEIDITPGINLNGEITMKIEINIDEFLSSGSTTADRTNRHISTLTHLMDGEVLAIGGLTQSRVVETHNKTPILSKIPLVGLLFKGRSKSLTKSDLYIFIRPTLIKPRFEGGPGDYTQLKLDYARLLIGRHEEATTTNDPIQKWFFQGKPRKTISDAADHVSDEIKQVNDYVVGKHQPPSTKITVDPYFKTEKSRTIRRYKRRNKKRARKKDNK